MSFRLLPIARPCGELFAEMAGDEGTRFCDKCGKQVFDLTQRTEREARELFRQREGQRTCVRVARDASGTIQFKAAALVAAVSAAACGSHPPQHAAAPASCAAESEHTVDLGDTVPDSKDECPDPAGGRDGDSDGCPAGPPQLALPQATCVLEAPRWNGKQTITELRLRGDGPVYALFGGSSARLHVPAGKADAGAGIEVADAGLMLRGYVSGAAFALRPAKPLVLGGFVVPSAFADLVWTTSTETSVSISYDVGPGVEVWAPLGASLPCDALTIDFAHFEQVSAVGDDSAAQDALLRLGHSIDLAAEPGGKALARLRPKDDEDAAIKVLESSGRSKRILWWRDTALVFGWVSASEVRSRPNATGTGYGTGHGAPVLPLHAPVLDVVRCDLDTPVIAEVEGQQLTVGSIRAGTPVEVLSRDGGYVSVQVKSRHLVAAPNARLLVAAVDLQVCASLPASKD